jgi:protein ImuB
MMGRVVSVWLPFFQTELIERRTSGGVKLYEPSAFAIIGKAKGGKRLLALNPAAREAGLVLGLLLTDACAMLPELRTAQHDPQAERGALRQLAAACNRFSPWVAPDKPDGLWIEATGLAHLFGGEQDLLEAVVSFLRRHGFTAFAAIASTAGAAWAAARFAKSPTIIIEPGKEMEALARLPVKALRIEAEDAALLVRLGLKTIGQILDIPRPNLRARLGSLIGSRINQALGHEGEALSPLMPEPVYAARCEFVDPLTAMEGLEMTVRSLIDAVAAQLKADGKGASRFTLMLFDTQNGKTELPVRMARPSCEPVHIARIVKERLALLEGRFDPTLGFDAATLYAMGAEPLIARQSELLTGTLAGGEDKVRLAQFLDRVTARLGEGAVRRIAFAESYVPEHASFHVPAPTAVDVKVSSQLPPVQPRPLMLLPRPEPIIAISQVPDYPPRQFTWRRRQHAVTKAEGPERISPEWWREESSRAPQARDYYRVEDKDGRRFWVYGVGYGQGRRWFMHGLFP